MCNLLFELSSNERMNILLSLQEESLRQSHISQRLGMTITETSRHLQRLVDIQLIKRKTDGRFSLTMYGDLAIKLLSDIQFISNNRQYFIYHDLSSVPPKLVNRLGELVSSEFENDAVNVIARATKMLRGAEEYIWSNSYRILPAHIPIIEEKVAHGVEFRGIYPRDYVTDSPIAGSLRYVQDIGLRLLVTDKEAMTGFLNLSGQPDYSAFFSTDPGFIEWCRDAHLYQWHRASV